ncbi:DUF4031 domain-containing protein [Burkholderia sp. Ac-20365]|uniref:DUF4031 domain-containing protein n=1 Tax=Burkholderia sp. Ac-20365 TaxID=2703897 RepID=UPI00197B48AA|nr:DUF4031 domain-containing protein [Burkholderia sp. Ac-20365]
MTVYVDRLASWGFRLRGRTVQSCHLFTDGVDIEELHSFAEQIGMRRAWFQPHDVAPHYDLTAVRRAAAVSLGAIEVNWRQASRIWRLRRLAVQAGGDSSGAP